MCCLTYLYKAHLRTLTYVLLNICALTMCCLTYLYIYIKQAPDSTTNNNNEIDLVQTISLPQASEVILGLNKSIHKI